MEFPSVAYVKRLNIPSGVVGACRLDLAYEHFKVPFSCDIIEWLNEKKIVLSLFFSTAYLFVYDASLGRPMLVFPYACWKLLWVIEDRNMFDAATSVLRKSCFLEILKAWNCYFSYIVHLFCDFMIFINMYSLSSSDIGQICETIRGY